MIDVADGPAGMPTGMLMLVVSTPELEPESLVVLPPLPTRPRRSTP